MDAPPPNNAAVQWAARGRNAMLTAVVVAPIALSAQNIIGWAADRAGLGLDGPWPYVVFFALDAAAGVCVMMTLILASRGERPGAFGVLVWVFACSSAFAGYRHGTEADAPRDAWWFFPLMSVLGPALLHLVLGHVRRDAQYDSRRRLASASASAYRLGRWLPGVGAFFETYCAWRVGRLEGIETPADAIDRYRQLCPNGEKRVLRAMRAEAARARKNSAGVAAPPRQSESTERTPAPAPRTPSRRKRSAPVPPTPAAPRSARDAEDLERLRELRKHLGRDLVYSDVAKVLTGGGSRLTRLHKLHQAEFSESTTQERVA